MKKLKELEARFETQYSEQFLSGMKARMEMSYFKYGDIRDAYPHKFDAIASLQQRLDEYKKTGNTEFLMDAANFAMIEFMLPRHKGAYFNATDSDQSPGRTTVYGGKTADHNVPKYEYRQDGD